MNKITSEQQGQIIEYRKLGYSIPEISKCVGVAKTTVQRYVVNVSIPEEFHSVLREKQGSAKERAAALRASVMSHVEAELGELSDRDLLLLLVGLYWGEGTKRDFGLINSDPHLIQTFVCALASVGITKERLSVSLRVHTNISIPEAKKYWAAITGVTSESIIRTEVIEGKKKGKLPYGMCRVRIRSGIRDRLFIQGAIERIGNYSAKKVLSPS